ncbi:nucleotidyltransferase domain-containing protein [uncultured Draconibacterium sp.]|uniref:nucleotidyltransferase domain-containing protein n=1 Tax=uncultured Draconibacterium sp. TaxID=1573823 RepID=UPI0025D63B66|nr:nucleotidyltransferase domain-containing protein [uncultured Draconibacterium sp.]
MDYNTYIPIIVEELKKTSPEKVILFGSYAYGTPTSDSDIDLLVIKDLKENEVRKYRLQLKKALWEKLKVFNFPFDLIVDSETRIKKRIAMGDLFYKEIYTKGKVIYA